MNQITISLLVLVTLSLSSIGTAESRSWWSNSSDLTHETRTLQLDADNLSKLVADTGAGDLVIIGEVGRTTIDVSAEVYFLDADDIRLTLVADGDEAKFEAGFRNHSSRGDNPYIDVTIRLPADFHLKLDDGSGPITISGLTGDLDIKDGSGSLHVDGGRNVIIDDGSGGIDVRNVTGNLDIEDGSGSIEVRDVGGDVMIKDGSGGIDVFRVGGMVTIDDGSGSINVDTAGGLTIIDDGSGGVNVKNINGPVNM